MGYPHPPPTALDSFNWPSLSLKWHVPLRAGRVTGHGGGVGIGPRWVVLLARVLFWGLYAITEEHWLGELNKKRLFITSFRSGIVLEAARINASNDPKDMSAPFSHTKTSRSIYTHQSIHLITTGQITRACRFPFEELPRILLAQSTSFVYNVVDR